MQVIGKWAAAFMASGVDGIVGLNAPAKTAPFDVELGRRIDDLSETIRQQLAVVPGVQSSTLAVTAPLGAKPLEMRFTEVGRPLTASEAQGWFGEWYPVGANYFETLRIPLVRGR